MDVEHGRGGRAHPGIGPCTGKVVGRARTDWAFTFAVAAYNLVRLPKLLAEPG